MWLADRWTDYELIDTGFENKLERWAKFVLCRPDPQAIWQQRALESMWKKADAIYTRSNTGGGSWTYIGKNVPPRWTVKYDNLTFNIKLMGFKHTGLFPEQAVNWDWFSDIIVKELKKNPARQIKILNLFAYTGGATVAATAAGAVVTHVDAAKGMVSWAKENMVSSRLDQKPVRWIVDDVVKFVAREGRRGNKYDAIIMDPPSYGRGPGGEVWKIENELYSLLQNCTQILSDSPLFFLVNSYTTGLGSTVIQNLLHLTVGKKFGGTVTADEIGLPSEKSGIILPCGISGRWER